MQDKEKDNCLRSRMQLKQDNCNIPSRLPREFFQPENEPLWNHFSTHVCDIDHNTPCHPRSKMTLAGFWKDCVALLKHLILTSPARAWWSFKTILESIFANIPVVLCSLLPLVFFAFAMAFIALLYFLVSHGVLGEFYVSLVALPSASFFSWKDSLSPSVPVAPNVESFTFLFDSHSFNESYRSLYDQALKEASNDTEKHCMIFDANVDVTTIGSFAYPIYKFARFFQRNDSTLADAISDNSPPDAILPTWSLNVHFVERERSLFSISKEEQSKLIALFNLSLPEGHKVDSEKSFSTMALSTGNGDLFSNDDVFLNFERFGEDPVYTNVYLKELQMEMFAIALYGKVFYGRVVPFSPLAFTGEKVLKSSVANSTADYSCFNSTTRSSNCSLVEYTRRLCADVDFLESTEMVHLATSIPMAKPRGERAQNKGQCSTIAVNPVNNYNQMAMLAQSKDTSSPVFAELTKLSVSEKQEICKRWVEKPIEGKVIPFESICDGCVSGHTDETKKEEKAESDEVESSVFSEFSLKWLLDIIVYELIVSSVAVWLLHLSLAWLRTFFYSLFSGQGISVGFAMRLHFNILSLSSVVPVVVAVSLFNFTLERLSQYPYFKDILDSSLVSYMPSLPSVVFAVGYTLALVFAQYMYLRSIALSCINLPEASFSSLLKYHSFSVVSVLVVVHFLHVAGLDWSLYQLYLLFVYLPSHVQPPLIVKETELKFQKEKRML
eukprot:Nk52_evm4s2103 gene=Nk52_evmTU4s2103